MKAFVTTVTLGATLALASGCARVKPWQREDLSRRAMIDDQEPGEARFDGHARGSREGAEGGSGRAGGGCGCN
jgi:hypothetical protein